MKVEELRSAKVKGKPEASSQELQEKVGAAERERDAFAAELKQLRDCVKDLEAKLAATTTAREAAENSLQQLASTKSTPATQKSGRAPVAKELKSGAQKGPAAPAADIAALVAARDAAVAARDAAQRKLQAEEAAAGQLPGAAAGAARRHGRRGAVHAQDHRRAARQAGHHAAGGIRSAPGSPRGKEEARRAPGVGQAALIALRAPFTWGRVPVLRRLLVGQPPRQRPMTLGRPMSS